MTLLSPRRGFAQLLMAGLLLLGAAAALPACDSDDSSDVRFSVQVLRSGTPIRTLRGRAASFSIPGDSAFTLDLQTPEQSGLREGLLLGRGEGNLPSMEHYKFAFPDGRSFPANGRFIGALEISFDGAAPTLYYAERGGLTITERSEGRVSGTFEFRAQRAGGTVDAPLSVRVVGRFTAQPGRTDDFPFTDAP